MHYIIKIIIVIMDTNYMILFNTKEGEIENTNHYLINFIIGTIILLFIHKLFFT